MVVLKTSIDDMLRPTGFLVEILIIELLQTITKEFLTFFKTPNYGRNKINNFDTVL